jgi:hypothetical protein
MPARATLQSARRVLVDRLLLEEQSGPAAVQMRAEFLRERWEFAPPWRTKRWRESAEGDRREGPLPSGEAKGRGIG